MRGTSVQKQHAVKHLLS